MVRRTVVQGDPRERIPAAVRAAGKPVTYAGLFKVVRGAEDHFRGALESAVAAGEIYRWPGRRPLFWCFSAEEKAREAILAAATGRALSKKELGKAAARKLRGYPAERMDALVPELVAANQLKWVPSFRSSAKLLVRVGDAVAYIGAARAFLEKKFKSAGFELPEFFTQDSSKHDKLANAGSDAGTLIIDAVRFLEPVRGVPVSTLRLRNHLSGLGKHEFDTAALELRKKQEVFLSQHVDPYNISQEDKCLLIDGQDGTYYVGIAIR